MAGVIALPMTRTVSAKLFSSPITAAKTGEAISGGAAAISAIPSRRAGSRPGSIAITSQPASGGRRVESARPAASRPGRAKTCLSPGRLARAKLRTMKTKIEMGISGRSAEASCGNESPRRTERP